MKNFCQYLCKTAVIVLLVVSFTSQTKSEEYIVKDGKANAQIIITKDAIRPLELAAEQLQEYIEKISGAKLPINNTPDANIPVKIYVGKSQYTDELKINGDELKHGGFRMVSGKDWLALIGRDRRYIPPKIHPKTSKDFPRVYKEWDKATGEKFGWPYTQLWKEYHKGLGIWEKDERGSFNATTRFLMDLGVRWYLPDPLGEVVPEMKNIALPQVDKNVIPDFPVRLPLQWARRFCYTWTTNEEALWQWRLGWSWGNDIMGEGFGAHGIDRVCEREETKKEHPEYYALYNGKRCTDFRRGGKPCLSSEGLFNMNVRYAKAVHDILGAPTVSVMPADAYTSLCQCPLCKGKSNPEKGYRGLLTDYVWGYVNKVATALYKIYPDMKVECGAYGTYTLPPDKIKEFSPNVVVTLCQHRQGFYDKKQHQQELETRKAFLEKLPGKGRIMINEKYRSGDHLPQFFPHIIAEDLKSLKGVSLGGKYEVFRKPRGGIDWLASLHLNLYVTSMFWWNADQDIEALLDDYYEKFYGPAKDEMKTFIEYSENNWFDMGKKVDKIDKAFELIKKAEAKVDAESVYGKRIALIHNFIKPLADLKEKFLMGRVNVPEAYVMPLRKDMNEKITVDGKLDEKIWSTWPTYQLKELNTGREPVHKTRFKAYWSNASNTIYFGIRCEEDDTSKLNISTDKNEDMNIFNGDVIEILLETLSHSYYQLVINPAGAFLDIDRVKGIETLWASEATVKTFIGKDFWSVEIAIPVVAENQAEILPFSGVAGSAPSQAYPWYFNLCRNRIRENGNEASAFSPTGGKKGFHNLMKFGKLNFRPKSVKK